MAKTYQSIDPALLALQTAKKAMPASPSTQAVTKPLLKVKKQQPQAIYTNITPPTAKIGGISSPFGAANINSSPVLGGATPQEIGTTAAQLQSLPKTMPKTGATPPDMTQSLKDLKATIPSMQSIDDIKGTFPEFSNLDDNVLLDLVETTKNNDNYEEILSAFPELTGKKEGNFITDLGSGIGQRVAGFGNLGKKLAFGAVDLYRQSQGKEKLTPEQRASAEQTPMGQALNTITNRQTPEQKASVGGQIGMVVGSVVQGAALGTPLTNALGKLPGVAQIATKAPVVLSKIAGGVAQGLEGQLQYSAAAEGKLPTGKELFTAGAFGGAVNAIGPIAKGIKDMKKPTAPFKGTRNKIAEGLVGSNLKNPAMREKYISKVGQTPEKTLLDEGITGSLGTQATKVAEKGKQAYDTTREALKSIPAQFKSDEGLWITNKILEGVDTSIPGIEDVIAPIKDMNRRFANGSASAMDMNDAKLLLARYEGLYDDFGRVKKTGDEFEKKALAKMYNNMKTEIENVGEQYGMDIKSMNKETQKREGLRGLMDRAVAREAGRDMISLSDYMLGGITIADPMTAIPLTLGKKFFSSPKVTSKIAKFLYSKGDDVITNSASNANMNVANGATKQGLKYPIKLQQEGMQVGGATLPKPMVKTPPITVEKGAIGMGTPKVNKTPVIPPKATVAPSVSAPKKVVSKYIPGETDISNYSLGEYRDLVKEQYPGIHTENDIQRMYKTLQDEGTITKAPKKGMPKLTANTSKVATIEGSLLQEAKKYKSSSDFIEYLRTSIDDYTEGDRLTAEPKGLEKQRLDFINYIENKYPNKSGWFSSARQYFDDVVSKNKPVPKKGMPKLGKETLEQNVGNTGEKDFVSKIVRGKPVTINGKTTYPFAYNGNVIGNYKSLDDMMRSGVINEKTIKTYSSMKEGNGILKPVKSIEQLVKEFPEETSFMGSIKLGEQLNKYKINGDIESLQPVRKGDYVYVNYMGYTGKGYKNLNNAIDDLGQQMLNEGKVKVKISDAERIQNERDRLGLGQIIKLSPNKKPLSPLPKKGK